MDLAILIGQRRVYAVGEAFEMVWFLILKYKAPDSQASNYGAQAEGRFAIRRKWASEHLSTLVFT